MMPMPGMIQQSLEELLSCCPEFSPLPTLSEESAKKVTFIGFSFPLNGQKPTAKLYFAPEKKIENLPQEIPFNLRNNLQQAIKLNLENNLQLYDVSLEQSGCGNYIGRLLWAIPSKERASKENYPHTIRRLLETLGHPDLALPLLRVNNRLQEFLQVKMAPLYHLGGFLGEDGSMFRIKANFDADICRHSDRVSYDTGRSLAATAYLLDEFGCHKALIDRIMGWNRLLLQNGYFIQFWGIHATDNRLESMKIYLKDGDGWNDDVRMATGHFLSNIPGVDTKRIYQLLSLFLGFCWTYYGFYLEIKNCNVATLKLYFHVKNIKQNCPGQSPDGKKEEL